VEGVTTYTYNDNDWLLAETTAGITTEYSYDANGNLLSQVSPSQEVSYEWNSENRLVGVETTTAEGTSNLEYQYDVEGIRVASIVDGVETRYLVDSSGQYAQVLEEYRPDGTTEVAYVYGNDLISQQRGEEMAYYLYDGHSGVRQLSDTNGAVTDTYVYDAYGNLLSATGETENNYLYRGEQFDPNVGLQYLRARYYDPSLGRFVSVDPFAGMIEEPMSRHRYLYGSDNPIGNVDPSGMFAISAGLAIQDILAASAIGIGAVGTYINSTSRSLSRTRDGWPWQWTGKLRMFSFGGDLSVANLTSECYGLSNGSFQKEGAWGIVAPFGVALGITLNVSDVIVVARSNNVPSIDDLWPYFAFVGSGLTSSFDTNNDIDFGNFGFRMGQGIGGPDPNGQSLGVDISLYTFLLGFSFPIKNLGDFPTPCVNTPSS